MIFKHIISCFSLILFVLSAQAQEHSNAKFGDVKAKDFAKKNYTIDSNANAVVIADIGSSKIEGNTKGWFSLIFKHYKRIHILNKNGYDASNISIALYTNGTDEEKLDKIKAVTYNLQNGIVVQTKLDVKTNLFKNKVSRNLIISSFTFPNVKEGSIIEFEYVKTSDFLQNLEPWAFQGDYPQLWSEYNLSLPDFLGYVFITQGYKQFDIKERKTSRAMFTIINSGGSNSTGVSSIDAGLTENRWVMKNVQVLKEESYTSTIENHIEKIEFQLSEYREPLAPRNIIGSWAKLGEDLMNSEFFGEQLTKDNGWLKDFINPVIKSATSQIEKAEKIFAYVRDNFTCTNYSKVFLEQPIKSLTKSKRGTVAEINLLLTALLRYADITADPVLLSTRSHGYAYPEYPVISKFNYVISRTLIDNQTYFLDATEPRLGFGHLPLRCYNGHARLINQDVDSLDLSSDMLLEIKNTTVMIFNNGNGSFSGKFQQNPGYYESLEYRNRISENGQEDLKKEIKKSFSTEVDIKNFVIDSLVKYENLLGIQFDFNIDKNSEEFFYVNPMLCESYKENPFKSAERFYPVEMPFTMDETFNLQMEVPQGYVVDELPKSMVVKLNDQNEGLFEYRISQSGDNISFRSRIKLTRANFLPDEYEMLREFFNLVVKKQSEQIVFKRKK